MKMKLKNLSFALAIVLSPATVSAATLSVSGGGASTLPSTYSVAAATGVSIGDTISTFEAPSGGSLTGGLVLDTDARIRITFLGKEAGAINAVSLGGQSLSTTNAAGPSFETIVGGGLIDLTFSTIIMGAASQITNGGTSDLNLLSLAFGETFNGGSSILAFFDDGRGDYDFDDMVVRIDAFDLFPVPVPASVGFLALVMGGIGVIGARRRKRTDD